MFVAAPFMVRSLLPITVIAASFMTAMSMASAQQNATGQAGLFVAVPSPITSDAVTRIKKRIDDARNRGAQRPSVVVFDFNPNDKDAATYESGECTNLASYIAGLHDVNTVAFVHKRTTGHTVLPVLACKEIAMGPQGQLGDILPPGTGQLRGYEANAYTDILSQVRPAQVAIARKMYDAEVQLRKGKKKGADWYIDLRDRVKAESEGITVTDTSTLKAAPDGKILLLDAAQAQDLGRLSSATVEDRRDLAEKYGVSQSSLRDDPLEGRAPVAFRYILRGSVEVGTRESVRRVAEKVVREKGNILFLQIDDCGGGDLQAARDLADDLRRLQADQGLFTVAFITNRAPDTAAIIALGCSEIVMSKRTDAAPDAGDETPSESEIGDFEPFLTRNSNAAAKSLDAWVSSLKDLADAQGYPPLLAEGMLRRDMEIVQVRSKTDRAKKRLMTAEELAADKNKNWESAGPAIKSKGQYLKLPATKAEQLGLARYVVDTREPERVYEKYGIEAGKVRDATPAWLDQFSNFLKRPPVTVLLVVIGFTGLILELKVPGTTVPGIIAALCFIMVFWAHTQFNGQLAVLAGLLFLLGLVLILIEVFVTPGFGAAGIFGILLMIGSLALVTVDRVPQSGDEWGEFGGKMAIYLFSIMAALVFVAMIARYLPSMPVANRLMLAAPDEQEGAAEALLPGAAQAAALLGAIGTAVTVLRPAGSVRFGDEYVDVVTDGGYVPAGARVQVIEVEGTRIVVKEI